MSTQISSFSDETSSFLNITSNERKSTVISIEKDADEDDILDPVQVELKIQTGRVINVLNSTLDGINVALSLKKLIVNNSQCLCEYINIEDFCSISNQFRSIEDTMKLEVSSIKDNEILQFHFNPKLYELIRSILLKYKNIKYLCEKLIEDDTESFAKLVVDNFKTLNEHIIDRLNTTAIQEKKRKEFLCDVYHKNIRSKDEIKELQNKLEARRNKYSKLIEIKQSYINTHRENINEMNVKCWNVIENDKTKIERQMANDWHISYSKQRELKEQAKKARTDYETCLENHLKSEKFSRKKRLKIETQLLTWVQKYDADMNERQNTYDDELKDYEDEQEQYKTLTEKFEEQKIIYDILMKEKADYEYQVWSEKVRLFISNTAARHIQRWYRRIMSDYMARKKALMKSLKKKKKK